MESQNDPFDILRNARGIKSTKERKSSISDSIKRKKQPMREVRSKIKEHYDDYSSPEKQKTHKIHHKNQKQINQKVLQMNQKIYDLPIVQAGEQFSFKEQGQDVEQVIREGISNQSQLDKDFKIRNLNPESAIQDEESKN